MVLEVHFFFSFDSSEAELAQWKNWQLPAAELQSRLSNRVTFLKKAVSIVM